MKLSNKFRYILPLLVLALILAACSAPADQADTDSLRVVATTTLVGDVVAQVGGESIHLHVLLPPGTDPHSFDPTPQDIAQVAEADLVFANGAGLEAFLDNLIESAGAQDRVIPVSEGIALLSTEHDETEAEHADHDEGEAEHADHDEDEGEHHDNEHGDEHDHTGADPHTWTDPNNVLIWIENIDHALAEADPDNAAVFSENAGAYAEEITELDAWVQEQVAQVPEANRKLVTDHALFGYFAGRYGFKQIGALIPAYSTLAEPTAKELAEIEDAISALGVQAIFVGNTTNPTLAERVAEDTGTELVFVYTGSLSDPDGEAPTYLEYMRYNTDAFVSALR